MSIGADEYEVRVGIERNGPERMIMQTRDNIGTAYTGVSIPMLRYMPVEMTIRAGLDDAVYLHQVRVLIHDCVNQGGVSNLRVTAECPCEECAEDAAQQRWSCGKRPSGRRATQGDLPAL